METILHTWDLANATGQVATLDPELADVGRAVAARLISPDFRNAAGDPFSAEVDVPASASAYDRLAAFAGRVP